MINKSATLVGTLDFANGNRTAIYVGYNSNTGATIMWQKTVGEHAGRLMGHNIVLIVEEIRAVLVNGEAVWTKGHNSLAWDALKKTAIELA